MKEIVKILQSSLLAGVAISLGCIVFLKVGGLAGAVLFAFGLLTCVNFKLALYTGTAGFISNGRELRNLFIILVGNILGCWLIGVTVTSAQPELSETAMGIISRRLEYSFWSALTLSACCGFIMTTAVKFAREGRWLPLLFGVPLFIMCGFLHCIADACYTLACPADYLAANAAPILGFYATIVLGNFIGCNFVRLVKLQMSYE